MRSVLSLLVVLVIVFLSYKLYFSKMGTESSGTVSPVQTIDVIGVKNDLLAIAQAERAYQAEHGDYASLDELASSGALTMRRSGRDGYTYEVETSSNGFRAVAHCPPTATSGCTNYAIDESMEIQATP
jgi:hypothetical protein